MAYRILVMNKQNHITDIWEHPDFISHWRCKRMLKRIHPDSRLVVKKVK
jgi:hypothetical protein